MAKEKIVRLSIIRHADFLGVMMPRSIVDIYSQSVAEITADLMVCLGGLAAQKVVLGNMHTGASGDLEHAQRILQMMTANGFFGPSSYWGAATDAEWDGGDQGKFLDQCLSTAEDILRAHIPELLALRDKLIEVKEMSGDAVIALLDSFKPVVVEAK